MKLKSLTILIASLLIWMLAGCAAQNPPSPIPNVSKLPKGTLEGTVVNETGDTMANIHIRVSHSGVTQVWKTTTDDHGKFIIKGLPALGNYRVTASNPPFWTTTYKHIEIRAKETKTLTITLTGVHIPSGSPSHR
ncbi:MAG: carboxypeptidase-like regulatory domain-containing protein [Acidobacteriota bacterium]